MSGTMQRRGVICCVIKIAHTKCSLKMQYVHFEYLDVRNYHGLDGYRVWQPGLTFYGGRLVWQQQQQPRCLLRQTPRQHSTWRGGRVTPWIDAAAAVSVPPYASAANVVWARPPQTTWPLENMLTWVLRIDAMRRLCPRPLACSDDGVIINAIETGSLTRREMAWTENATSSTSWGEGGNPDNVMLCVMPEVRSEDVTLHIQHTLIEAFCWENEIKMIKVDSWETLEKLVNEQRARQGLTPAQDVSCLLLEAPKNEESPADRLVSLYWQNFVESPIFPKPPVQLPG